MNILRRIAILLLPLLCLIAVVACTASTTTPTASSNATTEAPASTDHPLKGKKVEVRYQLSDPEGATLVGRQNQIIRWGETATTSVMVSPSKY